jgi:hypothetical protein
MPLNNVAHRGRAKLDAHGDLADSNDSEEHPARAGDTLSLPFDWSVGGQ